MQTLTQYRQEQEEVLKRVPFDDWCVRRTEDIAADMFLPWRVVHDFRQKYKLPRQPRRPGSGRPPMHDWSRFDPSLSDRENAARLGATLFAVRWHRRHKINHKAKRKKR